MKAYSSGSHSKIDDSSPENDLAVVDVAMRGSQIRLDRIREPVDRSE